MTFSDLKHLWYTRPYEPRDEDQIEKKTNDLEDKLLLNP